MNLLALLLLAATSQTPVKGTLCFGRDCRAVEGTTIAITPNDASRAFVWTSADAKTVVFGNAAAKAKEVDVAANDLHVVMLSVRGSAARGWPAETKFTLQAPPKGAEWAAVTIPAKQIEKLTTLRVPPGRYALSIAAPRHITLRRGLPPEAKMVWNQVTLPPAPIVSGTVVKRGEKGDVPVAGAQLTRGDGKLAGVSDEQGAFRVELSDPVPEELLVSHPGLGTKAVHLDRQLPPESTLGAIQLAAGHTLTVHVKLPESLDPKKVHVDLLDDAPGQPHTQALVSRKLEDNDVVLPDVAAGRYTVVVAGSDPLERFSKDVTMAEKDQELTMAVSPFRLEGTAKIGSRPIAEGKVGLSDRSRWNAEMPILEGKFGGVLWQSGVVHGWIQAQDLHTSVASPELGADPSAWDITLKDRLIAGRIYDAETKEPIQKATIRVELAAQHTRAYRSAEVKPDSTYAVVAADDGTYELKVAAPGYISESAKFEFGESDDASRTHDFALSRGVATTLQVVTPQGQPLPATIVIDGVASDGHNPDRYYNTDGAGQATVQLRANETRKLYFVPRDGSFAVANVSASRDGKPIQIVVPPPVGSLKLTVKRDLKQKLFPAIVLRYNGELIPQPVLLRLHSREEVPGERRIEGLPAGAYELWAVLIKPGLSTYAPLIGYVPRSVPVRVGLSGGEAAAEVVAQPLQ